MRAIDQLTVFGTGLLGTSLGLALKQAGFAGRRVGIGRRQATVEQARQRGAFDAVTTDPGEGVAGADLLVVAVPLGQFEAVLGQVACHASAGLIVTDVGSVKGEVVAAASRQLPRPERFVGAHPMAGSEQAGPEAAEAGLFEGKPCVLTPEAGTEAAALETVRRLWQMVGMRLIEMPAEEHDRKVATISHLPLARPRVSASRLAGPEGPRRRVPFFSSLFLGKQEKGLARLRQTLQGTAPRDWRAMRTSPTGSAASLHEGKREAPKPKRPGPQTGPRPGYLVGVAGFEPTTPTSRT